MKIVEEFEQAVREDEMKGGGEPEEFKVKEKNYKKAKQKLIRFIKDQKKGGERG